MIFLYKKWDTFCSQLKKEGIVSIPAKEVKKELSRYLVLKHDVETDVSRAFKMAEIENKYGHCGSYYVQAYLLENNDNVALLQKMQQMGHEISYHYDVMDSNKGNIDKAIKEFQDRKELFEKNGFVLTTVCQHGNPIVERVGYTSNRDFFRSTKVKGIYSEISDIMVDFKENAQTEYLYFSDAGRKFKMIYDPINNDVVDSSDMDKVYENLDELLEAVKGNDRCIISTHPHRWTSSAISYTLKLALFKAIKFIAKLLIKIPFAKKIMSKYYFLAKKI